MARPTYSDLILFQTPSAGAQGITQTALNNIITLLFKQAFRVFYPGEYDTYAVSVDHPTMDTTDIYSIIIQRATAIGNQWQIAAKATENPKYPLIELTEEDLLNIGEIIGDARVTYEYSDRQADDELGGY